MMDWVRPACFATSVKRARNGRPEGLPRGWAFTPREETPWPNAGLPIAVRAAPAAQVIVTMSSRRVIIGRVQLLSGTGALLRFRISARFLRASESQSVWRRIHSLGL